MLELKKALAQLDEQDEVRCIIITGNQQAFAAGADIKQMESKGPIDLLKIDQFETWDQIRKTKKPIIAAVSGFALGGGCELAMTCDMIIASETAKFGQPEIKIGIMPGAGGTQRLTRAVGKVNAMEMVLTGKFIGAEEAKNMGLVNRVVPEELYLDEAVKLAKEIALMSPIAIRLAKESVNKAFESGLQEGLFFERKNFYMTFASNDQKEGMSAFVEKRRPDFKGN
jgi:enoyl-CoA hydratase